MADDEKHRLTLHIPKPLWAAIQDEAKARFMSGTGLILAAVSKEIGFDEARDRKAKKP